MDKAIILTGGLLETIHAKTAHGLLRSSERFDLVAIVDHISAGKDAGEVLDGKKRGIPIYKTVKELVEKEKETPIRYAIIGVAAKGGMVPDGIRSELEDVLNAGISIINGLHQGIGDIPELANLAAARGLELIDFRRPKKFEDLRFWTGRIKDVKCPKIPVLGTDCALGKRTTARLLTQAMRQAGFKAEMIYTGQTGWLQGGQYGFFFDATPNDFISGELEGAILDCWEHKKPDIMFIEGQSGLRNPSGPCGSEFILSGDASAIILQHNPKREKFKDLKQYPDFVPAPEDEIKLIKMYGADTIALCINTLDMDFEVAGKYRDQYEKALGIPAIIPMAEGVERLVPLLADFIKNYQPQ